MNTKILFIFLVLVLVAGNMIKENLSKDFMQEASGGVIVKKNNNMNNSFNKDPNSSTFDSDLNSFIEKKASSDRAVVVNKDTSGLEVNKPADVKVTVDGKEQEEGSGCNDILIFALVLVLVIYIVYYQINFNVKYRN